MVTALNDPICRQWTILAEGPPAAAPGADGRTLAAVLGPFEPEALAPWHRELARAVDELHRSAGSPLRWDARDPIVLLLRALATLARSAPDASSVTAARLLAELR